MAKEILVMEARLKNHVTQNARKIEGDLKKIDGTARQSFGNADKASKQFSSGIASLTARFGPAALAVGVFAKATFMVADAIRQMTAATEELEVELSKVQAILVPTGAEFEALERKARSLGATTVFTATQSAGAFVEMGKRGFEAAEIIAASSGVLDLAAGTMTDMSLAAATTVATLNQFNLAATESRRVVDVMGKAFNTSALDMFSFSEGMKMAGPIAGTVGTSLEELTAAMAVLADREIKGTLAGTAMRRMLLELADENSKVSKAITDTGIETNTLTDKLRVLSMMNLTLGETTDFFTIRAVAAADILLKNVGAMSDLNVEYDQAEGTMKRMADTMLDNVKGATTLLESAQKELGITIGQTFSEDKRRRIEEATFRTKEWTKFLKLNKETLDRLSDSWNFILSAAIGTLDAALRVVTATAIFLATPLDRLDVLFKSIFGGGTVEDIDEVTKALSAQERVVVDLDKQLRLSDQRKTIKRKSPEDKDKEKAAIKAAEEAAKEKLAFEEWLQNNILRMKKGANKEGVDLRRKEIEKEEQDEINRNNQILDARRSLADAQLLLITDEGDRELASLTLKHERMLEAVMGNEEAITLIKQAAAIERGELLSEQEAQNNADIQAERERNVQRGMALGNQLASGLIGLSRNVRLNTLADERAKIDRMNISQDQKEALLKKADKANKDAAKKEKALAIAMSIINTALGVTAALKITPPAGYILAALTAALGAVEIATIASQSFQQGGVVAGNNFGGDNNVVNANSGEMFLTREQQGQLFALANGGTTNNNSRLSVNFNVAPGGNLDDAAADRIVESVDGLGKALEEADRAGTLNDFKAMVGLEVT